MTHVTSVDGSKIAYSKAGRGPALILVDGAFGSRTFGPNEALAKRLTDHFTVYTYDRRGRGGSDDRTGPGPEGVTNELHDLRALIDATCGPAFVYGISSGATLALEAARSGLPIAKLAVFEAPFVVDATRPPLPENYETDMSRLSADEPAGAIKLFMSKGIGLNRFIVASMRLLPAWSGMKKVANTLPYDVAVTAEHQHGTPIEGEAFAGADMPVLVLDGGKSPQWMRNGMAQLARSLPDATLRTLPGQTHLVKPDALVPPLTAFFLTSSGDGSQPARPPRSV